MTSLSTYPALNDALQALAPQQREKVIARAKHLHERNRLAKPKPDFDLLEVLKTLNDAQAESARRAVMSLLKRSRSAAYRKNLSLLQLIELINVSQRLLFEVQLKGIVLENRAANPAPEATLDEILTMLTVDQRDSVLHYAVKLIPSGRLDVAAEVLWIIKTLTTSQVQALLQRAKQLVAKRKLRGLSADPTIAEILVVLSPPQRDLILRSARSNLTCNAVANSNKRLKLDNPDNERETFPRWMTVQGGLSRK